MVIGGFSEPDTERTVLYYYIDNAHRAVNCSAGSFLDYRIFYFFFSAGSSTMRPCRFSRQALLVVVGRILTQNVEREIIGF